MGIDINYFYLGTPLDCFEYTAIPIGILPEHTKQRYNMREHAKNGFVYFEIRKAIYGLLQADILVNKQLYKFLKPAGYYEVAHTPGLWRHISRQIKFLLVVDDFRFKYVGKQHADYLVKTIEKYYKCLTDWKGDLYCGIQ